jgi:hypothetical protein
VLVDTVGVLAARNDILRVKLEEMRAQRDMHERYIHDQYEQLWRWLQTVDQRIMTILKYMEARHGDAKGHGEVGAKGKKEHGAQRYRRQPAHRTERAAGREDRSKPAGGGKGKGQADR